MSKIVLKLAGRRSMVLALFIMATLTLGLLFSGWFTPIPGKAQPNQPNPQPNQETTNCIVLSTSNTCASAGSISLVAPTDSPVVCIGSGVTLTATCLVVTGQLTQTITFTNGGNSGADACPNTVTNIPAPAPVSVTNWWEATVGSYHTIGAGLTAQFTPTDCGAGSVTFHLKYKNSLPCDTNVQSAPDVSGSFTVVAVNSLAAELASGQGGLEAGSDPPTYWVCPCPGDVIVTASSCPSLTADQLPACWTFTGGVEIDKLHHKVSKVALMNGEVAFTVTCGTSTKTIILKTDKENAIYYTPRSPTADCKCDNYTDATPTHDDCGNSLAVDCVDCWQNNAGLCIAVGHFSYRYNGISVGVCRYPGGQNTFLYKTTKHNCRILRTWHLTQQPTSPTFWTVTKYDCMTGVGPLLNCRTAPTWNIDWNRPADESVNAGYPANSCENQGTPSTPCPIHPTWN